MRYSRRLSSVYGVRFQSTPNLISPFGIFCRMSTLLYSACIAHLRLGHLFSGIYEFFQIQLTQTEVGYIQSLDQRNYDILVKACHARCNVTPALPGFERTQGLKRIDILGDQRGFWGLWITFDDLSNCWHLNLGLVNLRPGW